MNGEGPRARCTRSPSPLVLPHESPGRSPVVSSGMRRRRIQICKWTGTLLAVLLLSQIFARWKAFFQSPTGLNYAAILIVLSLFLVLMAALSVVVYAEEKARGRIRRTRPFFERWSDRLFNSEDR